MFPHIYGLLSQITRIGFDFYAPCQQIFEGNCDSVWLYFTFSGFNFWIDRTNYLAVCGFWNSI